MSTAVDSSRRFRVRANQRQRVDRSDPTQTKTLRGSFVGDFNRRWREVRGRIRQAVDRDDGFGISSAPSGRDRGPQSGFETVWDRLYQPGDTRHPVSFGDPDDDPAARLDAFLDWAAGMITEVVVDPPAGNGTRAPGIGTSSIVDGQHWTADCVRQAEMSGIRHAERELRARGMDVDAQELSESSEFGGVRARKRRQRYVEVYQELQGIADVVVQRLGRRTADGLLANEATDPEGWGVREMATVLTERVDAVGQTRTQTLANTFVVEIHNEATLDRYADADIEYVGGVAESAPSSPSPPQANEIGGNDNGGDWPVEVFTAGDDRVCDDCQAIEGLVVQLTEAYQLLPMHPSCRCWWALTDAAWATA